MRFRGKLRRDNGVEGARRKRRTVRAGLSPNAERSEVRAAPAFDWHLTLSGIRSIRPGAYLMFDVKDTG